MNIYINIHINNKNMKILYCNQIYDFLSIKDFSNFDIACTNNKLRKYILSVLPHIIFNTESDANLNEDYFKDLEFLKYIKLRKISLTSFVIFNGRLDYIQNKNKNKNILNKKNFINYLKIFQENIKIEQLINILSNYKYLKKLLIGTNIDENNDYELHYEMYPQSFSHIKLINFINNTSIFKIKNTSLEYIYIVCKNLSYDFCYNLILSSKKLKKLSIKTNDKNFLNLIIVALNIKTIEKIEIYDNTLFNNLQFEKIFSIFNELKKLNFSIIKLKIDTEDISGGNGHLYQTIIIIQTNKIKISFVLQYIINSSEFQYIFNNCPYLEELILEEDLNTNSEYSYLLDNYVSLNFSSSLINIQICTFNEINIYKIIDKFKTIKNIYINDKIFLIDINTLEIIKNNYKNINFFITK